MAFTDQTTFDVRCEWGTEAVAALSGCRTFIIVDILSFTTCVSLASQRGVHVLPYATRTVGAEEYARRHRAALAGPRGADYSLSPASLLSAPMGMRIVLPSPNGATVALQAQKHGHVLAGCLRNARAVAARAVKLGGPFAIIPTGERWEDGTLRVAIEDLIGAGAIAANLPGGLSPEASTALASFGSAVPRLTETLLSSASGRELVERGFREDVYLAADFGADSCAPELLAHSFEVGGPRGAA